MNKAICINTFLLCTLLLCSSVSLTYAQGDDKYRRFKKPDVKTWESNVPAGLSTTMSPDSSIGRTFVHMERFGRNKVFEILRNNLGQSQIGFSLNTYMLPGAWVVLNEFKRKWPDAPSPINQRHLASIEEHSLAAAYIGTGTTSYYKTHVILQGSSAEQKTSATNTENDFVHAIMIAAFSDNMDKAHHLADNYLNRDFKTKKAVVMQVKKAIGSIPWYEDEKWNTAWNFELDPTKGWHRLSHIQWAAFWLTNHYHKQQTSGNKQFRVLADLIMNNIEIPSRNIGRVRAETEGPFYYDSASKFKI